MALLSRLHISQKPSFFGKFRDFIPFDRIEYEKLKKSALKKKKLGSREQKTRAHFCGMTHLFKSYTNKTSFETADLLGEALSTKVTPGVIENALSAYQNIAKKQELQGDVL